MLPDREDLRSLARHSQCRSSSLQVSDHILIDQALTEQCIHACSDDSHKRTGRGSLSSKLQDQYADHDILHSDQSLLAESAEWETLTDIVRERDQERCCFQRVAEERNAGRRLRVQQFQDLGDLDDGGSADDAEAHRFGDGEGKTLRIFGDVEVEEERAMTGRTEEGDDGIVDGFWEVRGDWK